MTHVYYPWGDGAEIYENGIFRATSNSYTSQPKSFHLWQERARGHIGIRATHQKKRRGYVILRPWVVEILNLWYVFLINLACLFQAWCIGGRTTGLTYAMMVSAHPVQRGSKWGFNVSQEPIRLVISFSPKTLSSISLSTYLIRWIL